MSGCAHALAGTQNRNWKLLVVQAKRERIKEVSLYVTMENTFEDLSSSCSMTEGMEEKAQLLIKRQFQYDKIYIWRQGVRK